MLSVTIYCGVGLDRDGKAIRDGFKKVLDIAKKQRVDCTITKAHGLWRGVSEESATIEIIGVPYDVRKRASLLIEELKYVLQQEAVGVKESTVEFDCY